MEIIEFGNSTIEYEVIKSSRKTIGFEVNPEKGVLIRSPKNLSSHQIKEMVKKKAGWILEKQEKLNEVKSKPVPKEFMSGEKLPYLGRRYRLKVTTKDIQGVSLRLYQGKFQIEVSNKITKEDRRELIHQEVINWYKKHAATKLEERVNKYKKQVGKEPAKIKIKEQKKRWGSCSSLGNLNFNWKIIMAPMSVVDYIVVHELAHLKYPNHSKDFWDLVGTIIPNYKEKQEWLRINGKQLNI
ncbi:M48 family metallopeptidase [Selenihalanaerobacter shriftii]|uniref:YgjP-like metallopeptidase domain-containing protein n=1 Tax=Selenihalanaerobacter shriftii TaxID=142842 RepID=A0A1T4NTP7_9FIRM|nr:SprT family zinc-dependent metalloprotease [Selenihalanaerobacter shriftii]SJZ82649.1 hypothetical protein SAMN02745118_01920 [Selenihalanaerobacter shriftii]